MTTEELLQQHDRDGAAIVQRAQDRPAAQFPVTVEAKLGDDWADLTKYLQAGGEHAPDWGPPFPDPMKPRITKRAAALRPGPQTLRRRAAYRLRLAALQETLTRTGGVGNATVCAARAATLRSEHRREDMTYQRPARGQLQPNARLTTYGISVRLRPDGEPGMPILVGGTKRQQACYRRAVSRATQ